jgi:AcrR family transcriptional regulator
VENEKEVRVLDAAKTVFVRHGYRRVTMQDIAEEAGISRPALYLIYANKEEVFKAAARRLAAESMRAIRADLGRHASLEARLNFTFELWSVYPFQLMLSSPDAKEIVDCTHSFAKDTIQAITVEFEALLVEILEPLASTRKSILPIPQVAHLLSASVHGYKEAASSVDELRSMIAGIITLTLAALRV